MHHPINQSIIKRNRIHTLIKEYHSKEVEREIIKRGYNNPDIRHRREEKLFRKKHPTRRWVVERERERTNSWHNLFRKLFTRYEKKDMRIILVLYS